MNEPYLGQRCHVEGQGFGTIVKLYEDKDSLETIREPITHVRVELDAGVSHWYELAQVELIETHHAG